MPSLQYTFRECQNPSCRFRFPAPGGEEESIQCPKCGRNTLVQQTVSPTLERQSDAHLPTMELPLRVIVDSIRSTWNVGSIFRTADGAGVSHLYLCGITPTPENPRVARSALGAQNSVSWSWHSNSVELAEDLLRAGFQIWTLESIPEADELVHAARLPAQKPVILVIGNENAGIDPALLKLAVHCYQIPMYGFKCSLNAAVAFGIAVYYLRLRQE